MGIQQHLYGIALPARCRRQQESAQWGCGQSCYDVRTLGRVFLKAARKEGKSVRAFFERIDHQQRINLRWRA